LRLVQKLPCIRGRAAQLIEIPASTPREQDFVADDAP
jgi:hypothetical protein